MIPPTLEPHRLILRLLIARLVQRRNADTIRNLRDSGQQASY